MTASSKHIDRRISVAPMMDWTDRHCRFFLRGFSPDTLLYTEMITSQAILRGNVARLLAYDPEEHPVALQLGGSDPRELAAAARIGADMGYDEINLNCGCPSDRVHSGAFGACLMLRPALVADCVAAMRAAVSVPVTVKLRTGVVDATEPADPVLGTSHRESARLAAARFGDAERAALHDFVDGIVAAGCAAVIVHARKAVLGAWSPRDNREIPPLRYDVVREVRQRVAPVPVVLNGGLRTPEQVVSELSWADGVMLGREAYHRPMLLAELAPGDAPTRMQMLERMTAYARREMARGEKLAWIARHMLGLYSGQAGAKEFRRRLSEGARDAGAQPELLLEAGVACERADDAMA